MSFLLSFCSRKKAAISAELSNPVISRFERSKSELSMIFSLSPVPATLIIGIFSCSRCENYPTTLGLLPSAHLFLLLSMKDRFTFYLAQFSNDRLMFEGFSSNFQFSHASKEVPQPWTLRCLASGPLFHYTSSFFRFSTELH